MKRAMLTLLTLAVLLPAASTWARAGDRDDGRRNDRRENRRKDDRRDDDRRARPAPTLPGVFGPMRGRPTARDRDRDRRDDDRRDRDRDRRHDDRRGRDRDHRDRDRHDRRGGIVVRTRGPVVTVDLGRILIGQRKRWIPGHHEVRERHVRQPDRVERVWVPARYETRIDACGRRYRVLVEEGHYERRVIRGRVVIEEERVWIPGHWEKC